MDIKTRSITPRNIAESGIFVGLAVVLNLLSLGQLPNGGRISLEMLPIFYISFRRGAKIGMLSGGVLGIILLVIDPKFVHPVQVILDYLLPNILVGTAGFFPQKIWLGILFGGLGRFVCHFISGIVFFGAFAPAGTPVWLYSLIYNASYIFPQVLVSFFLLPPILKRMKNKN
jgi:thiamine transporter